MLSFCESRKIGLNRRGNDAAHIDQFLVQGKFAMLRLARIQYVFDNPCQITSLPFDNFTHSPVGEFVVPRLIRTIHCKEDRRERFTNFVRKDCQLVADCF